MISRLLASAGLLAGLCLMPWMDPADDGADAPHVRPDSSVARRDTAGLRVSSASILASLPDGAVKRQFILDCTGCHQFDARIAYPGGRARTESEWATVVTRMLGYAGATTPFPVIAAERDARATGAWLAHHLPATVPEETREGSPHAAAAGDDAVREFRLPVAGDLPHDLQVMEDGRVLITGMQSDRMYVLDPATGQFETVPIPVPRANPRAVELAPDGDWWVLLGAANAVAHYAPATRTWRTFDIGVYGHSIALDSTGGAWYNGHFTRNPEVIGRIDIAAGTMDTVHLPMHPSRATVPGGPIPYELRAGPDGRIWMSELQGNRMLAFDPRARATEIFDLPASASGPRRFDVDGQGRVWIPAYAANALLLLNPTTGGFVSYELPIADAVPYIARVDAATGFVWIGTSAADAVVVFDPGRSRFATVPLPSRGALIRHLAIDARRGDVWLAYGASPGIPARVARVRMTAPGGWTTAKAR